MGSAVSQPIEYMRNTVMFGKPYLWLQRKGENLRLLNLDQANDLARTELGIDPIEPESHNNE